MGRSQELALQRWQTGQKGPLRIDRGGFGGDGLEVCGGPLLADDHGEEASQKALGIEVLLRIYQRLRHQVQGPFDSGDAAIFRT